MKRRARTARGARTTRKASSGWDIACEIARRLPGVEVETSYGTPALKVKGKFLARLRTEAEGWLAIRCEFLERDMLLEVAPQVFHLTDHYRNYPAILVDLDAIGREALEDVIENGWRMAASPKAIREFDAGERGDARKRTSQRTKVRPS
ncbi:MAG TPA: MmcQ/YjbR family DNA-binding protein [Gammaproteobacteria bacterium]